ncbi:hypothetical protein LGK95_11650 [Clostridium algoriphilum]|uniref:hypothetical protein n=1 Tax=Clostridium algoriphilum TaxID=198347 RepID=UPI001CF2FEFA|nr:hypothetical protein [Clostridium algoriphilum]MCB2294171.1 hypothetical protein [Clostridium algoriphilum]
MNKDDQVSKEEKENSEIINKLYANENISEKSDSKTDSNSVPKLNDDIDESKKYIKEMHELADKNEFKNNIVVLGLVVVVVAIILFTILMNTSLMKPKTDVVTNTPTTKSTSKPTKTISPAKVAKPNVVKPVDAPTKIYEYLNVETNRTDVLKKAVKLNDGSKKGVTVYLLSEILRSNGITIPSKTTTVKQLKESLISKGWKNDTRFSQLKPGDICFTTDMPGKTGSPSHAYVFMSWTEKGKTDYANIIDGQLDEFSTILHKRNLSVSTTKKDKFSFYLRK